MGRRASRPRPNIRVTRRKVARGRGAVPIRLQSACSRIGVNRINGLGSTRRREFNWDSPQPPTAGLSANRQCIGRERDLTGYEQTGAPGRAQGPRRQLVGLLLCVW
jgi:hypothetical protein